MSAMINGSDQPTKDEQHRLHERNHLIWVDRQAMISDGAKDDAKTLSHASAAVYALMNNGALHVQD